MAKKASKTKNQNSVDTSASTMTVNPDPIVPPVRNKPGILPSGLTFDRGAACILNEDGTEFADLFNGLNGVDDSEHGRRLRANFELIFDLIEQSI